MTNHTPKAGEIHTSNIPKERQKRLETFRAYCKYAEQLISGEGAFTAVCHGRENTSVDITTDEINTTTFLLALALIDEAWNLAKNGDVTAAVDCLQNNVSLLSDASKTLLNQNQEELK